MNGFLRPCRSACIQLKASMEAACGKGPRRGQSSMTGEAHMESRIRWLRTPPDRDPSLLSPRYSAMAEMRRRKRSVWA